MIVGFQRPAVTVCQSESESYIGNIWEIQSIHKNTVGDETVCIGPFYGLFSTD
jgi:hypothetical protein